jgi:glycosyltransferase involved in cell wall biosynthesis
LISTENLPTPPTGWWGGIEAVCWDLCQALSELGHDVSLVARPGSKCPANGFLLETFPDVPDKLGADERHFNAYKDFVADFDGVVHDHTNGKKVHTIHMDVLNTMHWCQDPYTVRYRNISAVSHAHAKWLLQRMPQGSEVQVVHHGIKAERFRYQEKKKDYYLFFSVIGAYKGAFDALKLAKETGVKIVFAGRDGDATEAVKNSGLPNVTYVGEVSNEKRAELMSEAKALIFPTGAFGKADWLEVFGFVQLEALASGTPVISSANGACPEIIENGKSGFICTNYEEMKLVIKENRVEEISPRTCRLLTETRFSAKRMANDYLSLYKKIEDGEDW